MHVEALNLREVMVFLAAAGVVVPLGHRLRISPVFGFLVIGLVIGPYGLGRFVEAMPWLGFVAITDAERVQPLAELGVVFLLFSIGLELSVKRLWAMRRLVFGLGGCQVVVTGIVIAGIASLFDNSGPAAIVLGAGFALSSTAIVMQLLAENRRLGTAAGRTSFSILLFQDLAVLPILFLVGAFAAQGDGPVVFAFLLAMGQAAIAVAVILVVGQLVLRPVFRFVGSTASREMFLAFVLLVIIGTAVVTQQFGLSMALGAFLAGLLFAETEYRHEIEVDIEPFKGLLLGLFFVSVGMSIDVAAMGARPEWLAASVVGLFVIKGAIIYGLVRGFGEPRAVAVESGLLLGQGGEFAFLIVGLAASLGLMPPDTVQFMLIVSGITMVVTPVVAHGARQLARRIADKDATGGAQGDLPEDLTDHVIVVGYGRVGQMLSSVLSAHGLTHVGLDLDAQLVARARAKGESVYYGNASRPDMLRRVGVEAAVAMVVTMDSPQAAEVMVATARRHWPELTIYARARDRDHALRLIDEGASHVIPETTEASLQLSEMVLMGAGVPDEAARRIVEVRRQAERAVVDEGRGGLGD